MPIHFHVGSKQTGGGRKLGDESTITRVPTRKNLACPVRMSDSRCPGSPPAWVQGVCLWFGCICSRTGCCHSDPWGVASFLVAVATALGDRAREWAPGSTPHPHVHLAAADLTVRVLGAPARDLSVATFPPLSGHVLRISSWQSVRGGQWRAGRDRPLSWPWRVCPTFLCMKRP